MGWPGFLNLGAEGTGAFEKEPLKKSLLRLRRTDSRIGATQLRLKTGAIAQTAYRNDFRICNVGWALLPVHACRASVPKLQLHILCEAYFAGPAGSAGASPSRDCGVGVGVY